MGKRGWEAEKIARVRGRLLSWYEHCRRDLPWRRSRNPYAIWVSEIMLQQTRVAVVVERYQAFMARFPTLLALALATEQEVLAAWSGLGYYRRARMLHKTAQFVADHYQGNLPQTLEELRLLPGIGAYTAAAVASIAHGEPVAVVDGNVERVLCRMEGCAAGSRAGGGSALRRKIEELAARLVDPLRPAVPGLPAGRRLQDAGGARYRAAPADAEPRGGLRALGAQRAALRPGASGGAAGAAAGLADRDAGAVGAAHAAGGSRPR
jgi:adenine-specific DNA glycosylase